MMKKEDTDEKKAPSRGRIMQVVEVEEEDAAKQKVDVPVPSEIVQDEAPPATLPEDKEEKPDISASFGAPIHPIHEQPQPDSERDYQKEIQPLKPEEKRDIVSELFETKKSAVSYPDISLDKKSSPFGFILWVVILLAIVGIIGGGLIYFKQQSVSKEPVQSAVVTSTPMPTIEETETPTASVSGKATGTPTKAASPSATPKKTGLSIQVLNGSGEKGVASTMKTFLEGKGYNVVGTGNAKNFDYAKTEIIIKADKTSSLDKLKTDLSASYSVGSTSSTLDATVSYDAQVIIGKE
jgi:hypothetical protein